MTTAILGIGWGLKVGAFCTAVLVASTGAYFAAHGVPAIEDWFANILIQSVIVQPVVLGLIYGVARFRAAFAAASAKLAESQRTAAELSEAAALAYESQLIAEQASKAKSDFLANMNHELRTPLNAINGYVQLIRLEPYGPLGDGRYREYLGHVLDSGDHLLGIIDDILDLTRIEAGKLKIDEKIVDIGEILQSCALILSSRIDEKHIKFTSPPHNSWPRLRADPRIVRQMLLNALSNACKFSRPESRVDISGQYDDEGNFVIVTSDSGIGMSDDELVVAMERFGQVEGVFSRENEGTGLGLPLIKSLIELHDGRFEIESEKGVGTRVKLIFPAFRVLGTTPDDHEGQA